MRGERFLTIEVQSDGYGIMRSDQTGKTESHPIGRKKLFLQKEVMQRRPGLLT